MSVTICPKGNFDYCEKNSLIVKHYYRDEPGYIAPVTPEQKDQEELEDYQYGDHYVVTPFELNIANGSATIFFDMLGLDQDQDTYGGGEIDPYVMKKAISNCPLSLLYTKPMEVTIGDFGATLIESGYTTDRINNYFTKLTEIVEEACRREVDIVWY